MTVPAQTPEINYTQDGVSTDFPVPFFYSDPGDLRARRVAVDGTETELVNGIDFSATDGASDSGGTLTLSAVGANGDKLTIWRRTARNQGTDYIESGSFTAESHEAALDKAMTIAQEQDADLARTIIAQRGEAGPLLDPLADVTGKFLSIAEDGNGGHKAIGVEGNVAEAKASAASASGSAGSARTALAAAQSLLLASASLLAAASNPGPDAQALLTGIEAAVAVKAPLTGSAVPVYLQSIIREVRVNNGVPGRTYVPRFLIDQQGTGSTRRLAIQLYDPVIGEPVAYMGIGEASGWDGIMPRSFTAWGSLSGGRLNDADFARYTGVSFTVWFNTAAIDFSTPFNNLANTDPAALAINADRVLTKAQCRRMLIEADPIEEEVYIVAASGGDFTTLQAGIGSLLRPGTVGRGQFPYTYRCSASHQIRFKVERGHVEEWAENVVDQGGGTLVAQGMLVQMGIVIELGEEVTLWTEGGKDASGFLGPLFETSFGGVIEMPSSARLEQRGQGYVIHNDAQNAISTLALVGEAYQFFQIVGRLTGGTIWAHAGQDDWLIGSGVANEEVEILEQVRFEREAGSTTTKAMYGSHTSPAIAGDGGARAAHLFFRNCVFEDAGFAFPAVSLTTLASDVGQTARHEIAFENCRMSEIAGSDNWRLMGAPPNGASVSPGMLT